MDDRPRHLHRRRADHQPGRGAGGDRPDRPGARHPAAVPRRVLHRRASASTSSRPTARRSPASPPMRRAPPRSASTPSGTRSRCRCSSCGSCRRSSAWSSRSPSMAPRRPQVTRPSAVDGAGVAALARAGVLLLVPPLSPSAGGGRVRRVHPERHLRRTRPTISRELDERRGPRRRALRRQRDGEDDTVVLGYYGVPVVPGFGFSAIYTDQAFSLVITGPRTAIRWRAATSSSRMPTRFAEAGVAVVQLLPVGDSDRARDGGRPAGASSSASSTSLRPAFASCCRRTARSPYRRRRRPGSTATSKAAPVMPDRPAAHAAESQGDHDVRPYLASPDGPGEPVTLAYYGCARRPGFRVGGGVHRPALLARHHRHRHR